MLTSTLLRSLDPDARRTLGDLRDMAPEQGSLPEPLETQCETREVDLTQSTAGRLDPGLVDPTADKAPRQTWEEIQRVLHRAMVTSTACLIESDGSVVDGIVRGIGRGEVVVIERRGRVALPLRYVRTARVLDERAALVRASLVEAHAEGRAVRLETYSGPLAGRIVRLSAVCVSVDSGGPSTTLKIGEVIAVRS